MPQSQRHGFWSGVMSICLCGFLFVWPFLRLKPLPHRMLYTVCMTFMGRQLVVEVKYEAKHNSSDDKYSCMPSLAPYPFYIQCLPLDRSPKRDKSNIG